MYSGILRAASDNSGHAIVEAAVVFPVVILIILGIISVSLSKYNDVSGSAQRHRDDAGQWFCSGLLHAEDILRTRWMLDEDSAE